MTGRELAAEWADAEMRAVAEADRKFHVIHGPEDDWSEGERESYVELIAKVEFLFRPSVGLGSAA